MFFMRLFCFKRMKIMNGLLSMLFAFSIINPIDAFFPLKIPLFILLFCFCVFFCKSVRLDSVMPCVIVYSILILTSFMGGFMEYETDYDTSFFYYKTFTFLLLIPWCRYFEVFSSTVYSLLIVAFVCVGIYVIGLINEDVFILLYSYLESELKGLTAISERTFIGINFTSVYYSSACISLVIFPYLLSMWFDGGRKRYGFLAIVMGVLIFVSGLRAMMLAGFITFISIILLKFSRKSKAIAVSMFVILSVFTLFLVIALLNDKGELSLDAKKKLTQAFFYHLDDNPETLIWGNGVGATFDSLGVRGRNAVASELFYYEIIRFFGMPLGLLFLIVYVYPLVLIYKKRRLLLYWKAISIGYLSYLFAGGTNPYLISSNGMITLLIMYAYALNPYYHAKKTL